GGGAGVAGRGDACPRTAPVQALVRKIILSSHIEAVAARRTSQCWAHQKRRRRTKQLIFAACSAGALLGDCVERLLFEGGPVGWPAAPFHVALQLRTVGAHATLSAVDVEQVRATPERPREERNQPQPSPKPAISTHALRHREKLFILRSTRKS